MGLIVNGTEEEIEAQLALGNELLSHIARIRTHIVAGTGYSLSTQGWILWQPNVTGSSASAILANLERRRTEGRITLPADAGLVSQVLRQVRGDGYDLRQPMETDL